MPDAVQIRPNGCNPSIDHGKIQSLSTDKWCGMIPYVDLDTRSPNLEGAQRLEKLVKDAVSILEKGLPAKQAWLSQQGTISGEHIASSSMRLYYMINRFIQDVNSLPNNPPPALTGWGRGDGDEIIADRVADLAPEPVRADALWKAMAVMDFVSAPPEPVPVTEPPPPEASS